MSRLIERVTALGGVLYVILAVTGFALSSPVIGDFEASPTALAAHLEQHRPTALFWTGIGLESLGLLLLVLFGVRLAAVIARSTRRPWLAIAAGGLVVLSVAVKVASLAPALEAVLRPAKLGPQVVAGLIGANDIASGVALASDGAFVLLAGLAILAAAGLHRWLGWTAVLAGLALIASSAGNDTGQLAGLLWFIAAGWWMLRHESADPSPATNPLPTALPVA